MTEDEDFHPQHFRVKRLFDNVGQSHSGKVGTTPLLYYSFVITNLSETLELSSNENTTHRIFINVPLL